jgi:surfeit locus 1 family protein
MSSLLRHKIFYNTSLRGWTQYIKLHNSARLESTSAGSGPSQYSVKQTRMLSPSMILLGIIPIFTFALGTWQVERLKWKVNLIDELQEKLSRDPMVLPRRIK